MWFRGTLLCAAAVASITTTPASATMRIAEDRGGQIGHYLQAFAMLRSSGEKVMIDGNCLSACTLVLGLIPRSRICATDRARFGFHAAWMPDADGAPVTSQLGTQALWNIYPSDVRRWINRNGGLSRKMIYLQGNAVHSLVPNCGSKRDETRRAEVETKRKSERRADKRFERQVSKRVASNTTRRAIRYSAISTANDRR
ncbi:hypothetical protein [Undibacter mobilis]|uniref:hypothetical protein n=1 Tax=Undibacter mobilis TaxID=2292256 RepID=UPI001FE0F086|nr:hypothetical protein [Undibacter mobilis]